MRYFKGFGVLRQIRRECLGLMIISFLDETAYWAFFSVAVPLLALDLGHDFDRASSIYAAFAAAIVVCMWLSGLFTDWLGVRRSIYAAMIMLLIGRGAVAWAALDPDLPCRSIVAWAGIVLMVLGHAMVEPLVQAGMRRFTTAEHRGAGFNLWLAFQQAGMLVGFITHWVVHSTLDLSRSYTVVCCAGAAAVSMVVAATMIRRQEQLVGPGEEPVPEPEKKKPWQIAKEALTSPMLYKLMLLGVILVVLPHELSSFYPMYWVHVIGPDHVYGPGFATTFPLLLINPIVLIIGPVLLVPVLRRFSVYGMLTTGVIVSGLALLVMVIPAWGSRAYWLSAVSLIVLAVGEALWLPRWQEHIAAIAPRGREGTYLSFSNFPLYLGKLAVGFLLVPMLDRLMPLYSESDPILRDHLAAGEVAFWDSPSAMFLVLGIVALIGPALAIALRGWFTRGARRQDKADKVERDPEAEVQRHLSQGSGA